MPYDVDPRKIEQIKQLYFRTTGNASTMHDGDIGYLVNEVYAEGFRNESEIDHMTVAKMQKREQEKNSDPSSYRTTG